MTTFELPDVGEPDWVGSERDHVAVGGYTYYADCVDAAVSDLAGSLARTVRARDFIAEQKVLAADDCAGERAYNAFRGFDEPDTRDRAPSLWDRCTPATRAKFVAAAKAARECI